MRILPSAYAKGAQIFSRCMLSFRCGLTRVSVFRLGHFKVPAFHTAVGFGLAKQGANTQKKRHTTPKSNRPRRGRPF